MNHQLHSRSDNIVFGCVWLEGDDDIVLDIYCFYTHYYEMMRSLFGIIHHKITTQLVRGILSVFGSDCERTHQSTSVLEIMQ